MSQIRTRAPKSITGNNVSPYYKYFYRPAFEATALVGVAATTAIVAPFLLLGAGIKEIADPGRVKRDAEDARMRARHEELRKAYGIK